MKLRADMLLSSWMCRLSKTDIRVVCSVVLHLWIIQFRAQDLFHVLSKIYCVFLLTDFFMLFSLPILAFFARPFFLSFNVNSTELSSEHSLSNELNHRPPGRKEELKFSCGFCERVLILPQITTLDSLTLHTINPEKRCIHTPFSFFNCCYKYDLPYFFLPVIWSIVNHFEMLRRRDL